METTFARKALTRKQIVPSHLITLLAAAIAGQVVNRHDHAVRCKKNPDECMLCQSNIAYMKALSPGQSAVVLENPQARGFKQSFKELMREGARKNWGSKSKRGENSFHAAASLMAYHKAHFPAQYPR